MSCAEAGAVRQVKVPSSASGVTAGTFRMRYADALGEGGSLAFPAPLEVGEFLAQRLVDGGQLLDHARGGRTTSATRSSRLRALMSLSFGIGAV